MALLAFGPMLQACLDAGEEIDAGVVNMRFVKPLDAALVAELARANRLLVTVEEGSVMGGGGSAVAEALAEAGITVAVLHMGLPDRFLDHGDPALLLASAGLDRAGIIAAVRARLARVENPAG